MKDKILNVKADVRKLLALFEAIIEVFPSNQNTLIQVMLHNLQHNASHCVNYVGDEQEWKDMNSILKAIQAMKTYHDYHLIGFIVEELEMIFFANEQLELEKANPQE